MPLDLKGHSVLSTKKVKDFWSIYLSNFIISRLQGRDFTVKNADSSSPSILHLIYFCIPESFNTNNSNQLFDYK